MPTTAGGIHYPSSSDSIDIPGDLQLLAEDVESYITTNAVTATGSYTLTNKTLTSPVVDGSGVIFEGATADGFETTLTVTDPTADRTITLPNVTGTVITTGNLSDITDAGVFTGSIVIEGATADAYETTLAITDPTADRTVTFQDATGTVVLRDTTDTLTNKTLSGGSIVDSVIKGLEEDVNVVASAATGTINFDVTTASIWYYTSNATANHTLNFRYSSGVTLNNAMQTGDAITLVWMNTNGATAYYPNTIQIDGNAVTPKVPATISSGNANAIDVYSFTIIKTASATFTVLESVQKFV